MNKNVFKTIIFVAVAMIVNEMKCSERLEKKLMGYEKRISQISFVNCFRNMLNLEDFSQKICDDLGAKKPNFDADVLNKIDQKHPLYNKAESISFYFRLQPADMKKECYKILTKGILLISAIVAVPCYYFSKNK